MRTDLGDKLLKMDTSLGAHPALSRVLDDLRLGDYKKDFNDHGNQHTDYVDNDRGQEHIDVSRKTPCADSDKDDHSDITHGSGWRDSHSDAYSPSDSHTDSGRYRDYTDMCR